MAKRKKKQRTSTAIKHAPSLRLELAVPRLEMARGHDGLLRGEPEPVIVVGAYYANGESLRALGRTNVRFAPRGSYPLVVEASEKQAPVSAPVLSSAPGHERIVVFAVALEEDSGKDVARVYGALEDASSFAVWPRDEAEPSPRGLHGLVEPVTRVYVLENGRDLRAQCNDDELIGAVVATMPVSRGRHELRLPFVSERNDWVALLEAALR